MSTRGVKENDLEISPRLNFSQTFTQAEMEISAKKRGFVTLLQFVRMYDTESEL